MLNEGQAEKDVYAQITCTRDMYRRYASNSYSVYHLLFYQTEYIARTILNESSASLKLPRSLTKRGAVKKYVLFVFSSRTSGSSSHGCGRVWLFIKNDDIKLLACHCKLWSITILMVLQSQI